MFSSSQEKEGKFDNVIKTDLANCMDCYRCVRACPVKAISVHGGQATVVDSLCIQCGTCVNECPQHSKFIVSSANEVRELIASGKRVVCSIAPSFPAVFPGWKAKRLPSALRRLGFFYVSETAEGAREISPASVENLGKAKIFTACPAVVNYVEHYKPEYLDYLVQIVSPMIAHARMLRKELGDDIAVVFIGPCAAKKQEARREENKGDVQAVLTFNELAEWLKEEEIDLATCTESDFQRKSTYHNARLFPIQGGMLKTCDINYDITDSDVIHLSGAKAVKELFSIPPSEWDFKAAEPLFCEEGCIGGPGFPDDSDSLYKRKKAVINYVDSFPKEDHKARETDVELTTSFSKKEKSLSFDSVSEEDIERVLVETGKARAEDRLNCGACGYTNCREKAAAVVLGMAEPEMCMPQMRRRAQQRMDKIIENSPNGIVILDNDLRIIHMNNSFRKMFICNNHILGREISYLLNAEGYNQIANGEVESYEAVRTKYGIRYHERIYSFKNDNQYVGFYANLSRMKLEGTQIDLIKKQTVEQAKKILTHQVEFAQDLVHFLGKSTAESEALVKKMMDLYEDEE